MSVRTRRRHSAPSDEVPRRRVRTATAGVVVVPAALFFLLHGVSDISDGMMLAPCPPALLWTTMICARPAAVELDSRRVIDQHRQN